MIVLYCPHCLITTKAYWTVNRCGKCGNMLIVQGSDDG